MKNIICSVIGHKHDGKYSLEYPKGVDKDILIFCIRCDHKIDFSKYYDWSGLTNTEKLDSNEHLCQTANCEYICAVAKCSRPRKNRDYCEEHKNYG